MQVSGFTSRTTCSPFACDSHTPPPIPSFEPTRSDAPSSAAAQTRAKNAPYPSRCRCEPSAQGSRCSRPDSYADMQTTDLRVILSQVQILRLVVLSHQIDHDVRITNAVTNRFLVTRVERNWIHLPNISRLLQMTNLVSLTSIRDHARHPTRC